MNINRCYLLSVAVLAAVACDQKEGGEYNSGKLRVQMEASDLILGKSSAAASDESLPDNGFFSLNIYKGGDLVNGWSEFSQFPGEVFLKVGSYNLEAFYGDINEEGFEKPYFYGSSQFRISDNKLTETEVICYLANTKLALTYSDSFKEFFTDYSVSVISGTGKSIDYSKTEQRAAYFKPGTITVNMSVTSMNGASAILEVATIDDAQPQTLYNVNFDVDAGSSSLKVSFDHTVADEDLLLDISDDALTALPPVVTACGFGDNNSLMHTESMMPEDVTELYTSVFARAGIRSVNLYTESEYLVSRGWPESVELASADNSTLEHLRSFGLKTKALGASAQLDKFAIIDFIDLVSGLRIEGESDVHTFSIESTDRNRRVSEKTVINVRSLPDGFELVSAENVMLGSSNVNMAVYLKGDPAKISFQYFDESGDQWIQAGAATIVSSEEYNHTINIKVPFANKGVNIKAHCEDRDSDPVFSSMIYPEYNVVIPEYDVWATKAVVGISAESHEMEASIIKYSRMFIAGDSSGEWTEVTNFERSANGYIIKGLEPGTAYMVRSTCNIDPADEYFTAAVDIVTEEALQLPNSGFESWTSNGAAATNTISAMGKTQPPYRYWELFYPWSDESNKGWSTLNELTTKDGGTKSGTVTAFSAPYIWTSYVANSGTIPTTDCHSGGKAAQIRSVGWGSGSTAAGGASVIKRKTAGELYLGKYNPDTEQGDLGLDFKSRPTAVSFWSKYTTVNGDDRFIVEANLFAEDGTEIASGTLAEWECGPSGEWAYENKIITLYYYPEHAQKKAASVSLRFVSGSQLDDNDFSKPPTTNLSNGQTIGSQLLVDDIELVY